MGLRQLTVAIAIATTLGGTAALSSTPVSAPQDQRRVDPSLETVLNRAVAWVMDFERAFSAVVAEETFEQRQRQQGGPDAVSMTRSDFLLVLLPGREAWLPFRDVFEVNGRKVRDRNERLQRLFLDAPATALDEAKRISGESSRYNIGSVVRTINVPTFGLLLLRQTHVNRFQFKRDGEQIVDGRPTLRLEFVERVKPTVVRDLKGRDVPLEGRFWIDPASGEVVRTLVKTRGTPDPDSRFRPATGMTSMWVEVRYARDDRLGMSVPVHMNERAWAPNFATVSGSAAYSNFRRFNVATSFETTDPR